jgi:aspartate/methionine/tyrosine aminotransferase
MPRFAPTILDTADPAIPTARAWAARYRGQHGPALDLTQAAPGYPPHPELLARLAEAAGSRAAAAYGPIAGDPALREALAEDVALFYGATVAAAQVTITAGCNLAFAMAMKVVASPGDNLLVPTPWYFNHQMALNMAGIEARPLPCRAEDRFVPDPELAATLIDGRTQAILLVTPNNPTGAVYPREVIHAFAELARQRGIWLILDETYRDFLTEAECPPHALFGEADWRTCSSISTASPRPTASRATGSAPSSPARNSNDRSPRRSTPCRSAPPVPASRR